MSLRNSRSECINQEIRYWVTQKNVPCFLNIYIYRLNWDISNLFAVEDPLINVLLLVKISNDYLQY